MTSEQRLLLIKKLSSLENYKVLEVDFILIMNCIHFASYGDEKWLKINLFNFQRLLTTNDLKEVGLIDHDPSLS